MLAFYLSLVESDEDQSKVVLIYTKHREYMLYRAYGVLRNKSDSEDAVHEAMLRIIKVINKVDTSDEKVLRFFCGRVAENAAKDLNRRQKNEYDNFSYENMVFEPQDQRNLPEEALFSKKAYEIVLNAIQNMNHTYKDVCMLKFLQGFDDMEISVLLNMNYKTVSVYASRGRQIIRTSLLEEGIYE